MAWTAPMTFTDGTPLTAAQLNTHLRDNLIETAPAKASREGGYFVTTGPNSITERLAVSAIVPNLDNTSSTSYDDLDITGGPTVTTRTGSKAFVIISGLMRIQGTSTTAVTRMSYEVSGDSSIAPADTISIRNSGASAIGPSFAHVVSNLTPGTNTFTAKYRVSSGTGDFSTRRITVFPL